MKINISANTTEEELNALEVAMEDKFGYLIPINIKEDSFDIIGISAYPLQKEKIAFALKEIKKDSSAKATPIRKWALSSIISAIRQKSRLTPKESMKFLYDEYCMENPLILKTKGNNWFIPMYHVCVNTVNFYRTVNLTGPQQDNVTVFATHEEFYDTLTEKAEEDSFLQITTLNTSDIQVQSNIDAIEINSFVLNIQEKTGFHNLVSKEEWAELNNICQLFNIREKKLRGRHNPKQSMKLRLKICLEILRKNPEYCQAFKERFKDYIAFPVNPNKKNSYPQDQQVTPISEGKIENIPASLSFLEHYLFFTWVLCYGLQYSKQSCSNRAFLSKASNKAPTKLNDLDPYNLPIIGLALSTGDF